MARPRVQAGEDTVSVAVRLPESVLKRLDRHVARMRALLPGFVPTRADAVRALILEALDRAEGRGSKGR